MSTAAVSNSQTAHPGRTRSRRAPARPTALPSGQRQSPGVAPERAADIVIRIPGVQDSQPLAELVERTGADAPQGGLMVAAQGARLVAAISTASGETLVDAGPAGAAAEGILRHRVAQLRRRRTRLRRPGTPS
jgi:hypothetical protein